MVTHMQLLIDFYMPELSQITSIRNDPRSRFVTQLCLFKVEGIKPHHLAVDRPSHKFLAFLQKHYHLKASIPQVNNFVVFDSFFRDKPRKCDNQCESQNHVYNCIHRMTMIIENENMLVTRNLKKIT